MTIIRYQGKLVGFIGATRYGLIPELADRPADLHRLTEVCEWALEVRRLTGYPPGRAPKDDRPPQGPPAR